MGQGILLLGSLKAVNLSPLSSVISWFLNECYCAMVSEGAVWGELTRFEPFFKFMTFFLNLLHSLTAAKLEDKTCTETMC